jgi:hypothetical protein
LLRYQHGGGEEGEGLEMVAVRIVGTAAHAGLLVQPGARFGIVEVAPAARATAMVKTGIRPAIRMHQ